MYHSWNIRKLLRYLAFDLALILAAICFTHFGKQHFAAVNMTHAVPLPILMYHSITELPERDFCVTPDTLEQDFQYLRSNGYEALLFWRGCGFQRKSDRLYQRKGRPAAKAGDDHI